METYDPKDSVQNEQFDRDNVPAETTPDPSLLQPEFDTSDKPQQSENIDDLGLTQYTDETDDDEINVDPSNIDESLPEIAEDNHEHIEDYSQFSKEELINRLANLLSTKPFEKIRTLVEIIKSNFYKKNKADFEKFRQEAEDRGEAVPLVPETDPLEERLKDLLKKYRELKALYNQKSEAGKQKNLQEKYKIIDEIKDLINRKESINETFQQFRELQNRWRSIGVVPQQGLKDMWDTYHHFVEMFYDFIKINKELRDLDLKKNLEAKIELCEKAEDLLLESSVLKAFNALQKLHEQWREIGPVPQEMKTEIWERFKTITAKINKHHQEYYEKLKELQKKNLESKTILCERTEELSNIEIKTARDWEQRYQEMVELQKIWRGIGFTPKKDNNKIYNRFRTACDNFFSRKREFFAHNKEEQINNLQLKTDLCIQAETLMDSNEWKAATEDFIKLQKKWKEIGPVPRKQSDQIWKRFRAACDHFFNGKAQHYNSIDSQYEENHKLKLNLISEIEAFVSGDDTEKNFETLKDFQHRWSEIGFVPLKFKEEVQKKYREVINRHFDNLNIDDARKNIIKFKNKIENLSTKPKGERKLLMERDKYISKLKQLENDIVVLENNIGFFAKSKNAESMIAEVQRKIQAGKDEIKLLEEKVRMIDSMDEEE
jgi:hypothetical protein